VTFITNTLMGRMS